MKKVRDFLRDIRRYGLILAYQFNFGSLRIDRK